MLHHNFPSPQRWGICPTLEVTGVKLSWKKFNLRLSCLCINQELHDIYLPLVEGKLWRRRSVIESIPTLTISSFKGNYMIKRVYCFLWFEGGLCIISSYVKSTPLANRHRLFSFKVNRNRISSMIKDVPPLEVTLFFIIFVRVYERHGQALLKSKPREISLVRLHCRKNFKLAFMNRFVIGEFSQATCCPSLVWAV